MTLDPPLFPDRSWVDDRARAAAEATPLAGTAETHNVRGRGPKNGPYFSERNRFGCRTIPLGRGWRLVLEGRRWRRSHP